MTARKLQLPAVLSRNTVTDNFEQYLSDDTELDLSNVTEVDTAGLAWIIRLLALAEKKSRVVTLSAVPERLIKLAKISHVDTMLPIKNNS